MSANRTRRKPLEPRFHRLRVTESRRLSPGFQRLTVTGDDLATFRYLGHDHWFRLFLQLPHQPELRLPRATGNAWWPQYLAIPEQARPHCSNYTVRDFRAATPSGEAELDIDFVLHSSPDGAPAGGAAIWACAAQPGDALAILDQGTLYNPPDDASEVHLVADESGLPAVAGIARSLPRDTVGSIVQEVAADDDRRNLGQPEGVQVTWTIRQPDAVPGRAALEALETRSACDPNAYAFVVGESTLATRGRRHLHRTGLPKPRITFSGFWKHTP